MVPVRRSPFFSQTVSASAGSAQLVASAHTTLRNNFIETDFTASIKTAHYPAASPAVHPAADRRAGHLAQLAGLGRAARWVGRTLAQLPDETRLPWHRVLAAGGRLSLPAGSPAGDEQRARLRSEGLLLDGDRVDLRRHGWHPEENYG